MIYHFELRKYGNPQVLILNTFKSLMEASVWYYESGIDWKNRGSLKVEGIRYGRVPGGAFNVILDTNYNGPKNKRHEMYEKALKKELRNINLKELGI
jgi:hypothetical protein